MSRKELSASPSARLITLTSTLIILHITKTSSNNCFSNEVENDKKVYSYNEAILNSNLVIKHEKNYHFCGKIDPTMVGFSVHNTFIIMQICKLCEAIFFIFYNFL